MQSDELQRNENGCLNIEMGVKSKEINGKHVEKWMAMAKEEGGG